MTTHDDGDLERIFRAGLTHHAQEAPTELSRPVPSAPTVRTTRSLGAGSPSVDSDLSTGADHGPGAAVELPRPRAHSSWRWTLPAAAAVAVLAIPLGAQLRSLSEPATPTAAVGGPTTPGTAGPSAADPAGRPDGIPANWRPESYGGVQIWVPSTWGWGGTPITPEWGGGRMDCSELRAFTIPGSSDYEFVPDTTPYVGRPVMMTDACGDGGPDAHPLVEAAWLGAPVEVGTQTYADGVVRETRLVGGVTVTAFGKDTDRIHQILDSARAVAIDANGCVAEQSGQPPSTTTISSAESLSVCVYDTTQTSTGTGGLLYSMTLGAEQATAYRKATVAAVAGRSTGGPVTAEGSTTSVLIGLHGQDDSGGDAIRWDVLQGARLLVPAPGSPGGSAVQLPLTKALVAPWASNQGGIKAYVVGPRPLVPEVAPYFRGILG